MNSIFPHEEKAKTTKYQYSGKKIRKSTMRVIPTTMNDNLMSSLSGKGSIYFISEYMTLFLKSCHSSRILGFCSFIKVYNGSDHDPLRYRRHDRLHILNRQQPF